MELALLKEQKYEGLTVDNVIFKQFTEMRNRIRFLVILSRDGGKTSVNDDGEFIIESNEYSGNTNLYSIRGSRVTYDTFDLVKAAVIKKLKSAKKIV